MSKPECYEFSLYVRVTDPEALKVAAKASWETEGNEPWDDDEWPIQNCLRQLLDPGMSPPGCEILDSTCE